jgi:hypothetical protein
MSLSVEFLLSFAATLALVFILVSALEAQHSSILASMENQVQIAKAKKAARTVESWLNNGRMTELDFTNENLSFRIEERFIVDYNSRVIEVEGVFRDDPAEPV